MSMLYAVCQWFDDGFFHLFYIALWQHSSHSFNEMRCRQHFLWASSREHTQHGLTLFSGVSSPCTTHFMSIFRGFSHWNLDSAVVSNSFNWTEKKLPSAKHFPGVIIVMVIGIFCIVAYFLSHSSLSYAEYLLEFSYCYGIHSFFPSSWICLMKSLHLHENDITLLY